MKLNLFRLWREPTALERATQGYADAQTSLLEAQAHSEHYTALVTMYKARIARLRASIQELSQEREASRFPSIDDETEENT